MLTQDLDHALAGLAGDWTFTRSVSGGPMMRGAARLSPLADARLHYAETGRVILADGKDYAFERRYIYELRPGGLRIWFDETPPRLFQDIDLVEGQGQLSGGGFHNCAPDTYTSSYRFDLPAGFRIAHDVAGPRKAYVIATHYARPTTSRSEPSK